MDFYNIMHKKNNQLQPQKVQWSRISACLVQHQEQQANIFFTKPFIHTIYIDYLNLTEWWGFSIWLHV